ncbi:MAG: N-acetyltransferase [Bacteroidetes bacterium]|nr:N-acetyltransferase [Bacteroidota bacterium]
MATENWKDIPLIDNEAAKRFEMQIENHLARIEYILAGNKIFLTHTEVDRALEGRGLGSTIIQRTLDEVRRRNLKLVPLCPFVAAFLQKNRQYVDLLADGYHV